ncbi:hypothetical protein A0256_03750 [Mucilaginibacter sp. PAMC 26640]|nr:hypothetical protein A0256_03750 [Mucilaginibacter sp. PAMC 26640]
MGNRLFAHRWQKIAAIILLSLLGLTLVVGAFINFYLSPILVGKIKAEVAKSSDNLYHIDIKSLDFSLFKGKAVLHDIRLQADTNVYNRKKLAGNAPNNLYELHVDRLVISDLHPFTLYFKKKLNIGLITLNKPDLILTYHRNQTTNKDTKDSRTLWQKISKSLKVINVGEIRFDEVKLVYKDYALPKVAVSQFKELNLKAVDLLIDSATQTDTSRFFYCKDVIAELHNYKSRSADGMYNFSVKSVKLSTQTALLTVAGVNLQPADHMTFFKKRQDDLMLLKLNTVSFNNFDYLNFQKSQELDVARIVIDKGEFEIFSNYNGQLKSSDRVVTFPNWALRNLVKTNVNADTLDLKQLRFTYKEYNKKSKKTGVIFFTSTNGRFLNMTNKQELLKRNANCTANLTSYFMGKAKFKLRFDFNLRDSAYSYSFNGGLAPMDMKLVNPAIMPLSLAKITSGRAKSLYFAIHGNQNVSSGKVSFLYNDLKVDLLNADYSKKTLLSALANTIILKHDNPDDGSTTPRTANFLFIRPKNFPFFKTVWQSLLSGIKPCAGIGQSEEKKFDEQTNGKTEKEQERLLKDATKRKEQLDKDFKKELEKRRKEAKKKS